MSAPTGDAKLLCGLTLFARILSADGITVGPERVSRYARALASVDIADRDQVFWAGFATLCSRREELPAYARAFASAWSPLPGPDAGERTSVRMTVDEPPAVSGPLLARANDDGEIAQWSRYSAVALDRTKDFAAYTPDDFARYLLALRELRLATPTRVDRRYEPARRGRLDVRRTLRRALATAGEPIDRKMRAKAIRPRRIVALCDVSGSMEKYTRALLAFVHAGVVSDVPFEAFALGTRTIRLTRALRSRDPDRALADVAKLAADWGSGTRLGATLQTFVENWGARGMARGAVVVILSDGWDRGDIELLGAQMARLSRLCKRIVWVNPRRAAAGYEPLAAGMAAALPYVDAFLSGNNLEALDEVARAIFIAGTAPHSRNR